jgi:hypothetical protein
LTDPDNFEEPDEVIRDIMGVAVFERMRLLAHRTAEMHI